MNRVRQLAGVHSYARELGLDPLGVLRAAIAGGGTGAWLDLCCGTGRALIRAAIALVHALPVEPLEPGHFGVQIVRQWHSR